LSADEMAEVLADFRLWLMDAAQAPAQPPPTPPEMIDLFTLVGQFTALRQEVNLQTRAVRGQQEQSADTLRQNTEVIRALQNAQLQLAEWQDAARQQELEAAVRPLLTALMEVADSQLLSMRELARTSQTVIELIPRPAVAPQGERDGIRALPSPPRAGFLATLLGINRLADYQRELAAHLQSLQTASESKTAASANVAEQIGRILESALAGLAMGMQRIERAMGQFDLVPIATVGQAFDPERMEAVEVVANSSRPAGEVIGELRRGYLWKGKVFRFAQVQVAK
jgi:molecular chaperone GrpE